MATNTDPVGKSPIFIHSLFRSGSTYLFKVFRRSPAGYWCYQEPLHELAVYCRDDPSALQEDHGEHKAQLLRHPDIEGSYFLELQEVWPAWKNVISEQIIYDAYFASRSDDIGEAYWRTLAEAARGRPVFQECRTAGRIGALKSQIGGDHIYLWRNPWDQWWSYRVASYFDTANQLIIHSRYAPQPVQCLLASLDLPVCGCGNLAAAFAFYGEKPFTSEQSYLSFYLLWCLGMHEGVRHADLMLSIDRLSDSVDYQSKIQGRLKDAGIEGVSFADCRIPQGWYLEFDKAFFTALEGQVHHWLIEGGWTQQDIDQVQALRQQYQPASWNASITNLDPKALIEQASRARELARRFETTLAQRVRSDANLFAKAEAKAQQAEAKAQQAEAQALQAEAKAQQAEVKVHQAEVALEASRLELHAAQQDNHHHRQLAEERSQHIQALHNSMSWRITAPLRSVGRLVIGLRRQPNIHNHASDVVQPVIHRTAVSVLNWSVKYAQKAPRFRRVALTLLNHMPGMAIKLRQMHIGSQLAPHLHHDNWSVSPESMPSGQAAMQSGCDRGYPTSTSAFGGINARQRTPLEAYFHAYERRE